MKLGFKIGDVTIAVASSGGGPALAVHGPEVRFLAECQAPDVSLRVQWGDLRELAGAGCVFDSGALWKLYRDGTDLRFQFTSPVFGSRPYKECRFREDFSGGDVILDREYLDRGEPTYPLEYPADELLMVNVLARGRGVETHACGLVDSDGRGYLFLGESGAGKTTTARLWDSAGCARVLSDDRVILRILDGVLWMYGTPWHGEGEYASPERARVDRIFFLKHAAANAALPLRRIGAVEQLMASCFLPFHSREGLEFTLSFLERAAELAPGAVLEFAPDRRAVDFVRKSSAL